MIKFQPSDFEENGKSLLRNQLATLISKQIHILYNLFHGTQYTIIEIKNVKENNSRMGHYSPLNIESLIAASKAKDTCITAVFCSSETTWSMY